MAKQRPASNKSAKFRSPKVQNKRNKPSNPKNGINKRMVKVQDARQKIIQKKRKTVVDAREVLTKMAKVRDARLKINNIRDGRGPGGRNPNKSNVKVIGTNIVQKTDRNGKISLVTNKSKQKSDINLAIQKQLGLIATQRAPLRRNQAVAVASASVPAPIRNIKRPTVSQVYKTPLDVHKTILNDLDYYESPLVKSGHLYDPTVYKWTKTEPARIHPASRLINSLEVREPEREPVRSEYEYEWPTFATHRFGKLYRPFRFQSSSYVDLDATLDEEMPLAPVRPNVTLQGTSRVTNVRSRLDSMPQQESHGIFSQPKAKVVVPAGHRIVVSNLQPSVTQDDIKELFEDIGQLLAAKLVRPGVAEVIYKNLKDAQKAVDTYHNRQLDGQPMKCLLVNKRPLNQPTAPPVKSELLLRRKIPVGPCPPANKLVPDIDTIHKVLFRRK